MHSKYFETAVKAGRERDKRSPDISCQPDRPTRHATRRRRSTLITTTSHLHQFLAHLFVCFLRLPSPKRSSLTRQLSLSLPLRFLSLSLSLSLSLCLLPPSMVSGKSGLDAPEGPARRVRVGAVLGDVAKLAALVALGALIGHRAHRGDVAELAAVEALRAAPAARGALGVRVLRLRAVPGEVAPAQQTGGSQLS